MSVAVVLVSAGKGTRLGAGIPKAAVTIAGKSLLELSLENIAQFNPDQLVVVAPEERIAEFESIAKTFFSTAQVVPGGETRQDSVAAGLNLVTAEKVLVHDAARALMPAAVFESVAKALSTSIAVVPAIAIPDTVKQVQGDQVRATIDRTNLRLSQTPQGFRTHELKQAISNATAVFTDEAALMESIGQSVATVAGSELGFKITTPGDLERAKSILGEVLTGIGTDAHAFSEAGTLILGCLAWEGLPKLEGHSDGDSVAHAIVDALLSAAALGDIGSNFGVDREEYAGASGEVFITGTLKLLEEHGFEPVNVAVQIIADRPKIGPRRAELERRLTDLVGSRVSVSATTTDGLGFLADARGVAAVATALIRKRS